MAKQHLGRRGPSAIAQFVAFALPFVGALSQTRGAPLWRTDNAMLSVLTSPTGLTGALSTLLSQLSLNLPLGSHGFRAALPGSLFLGLAGACVLHLCHWLFRKQRGTSGLDQWLALGASLSVSLSLPWLSEASVVGGATIGAGLALLLLVELLTHGVPRTLGGSLFFGLFLGGLFSQSVWCASLIGLLTIMHWPQTNALAEGDSLRRAIQTKGWLNALAPFTRIFATLLAVAITVSALWVPALIQQSALTSQFWEQTQATANSVWPIWSPLAWITSIGFLWCGGAVVAVLVGLSDKRPVYALAIFIGADLLAPGNATIGWNLIDSIDTDRLALHLLALSVTAALGALGLRTLGETAHALKLFAARPLAAMAAVLAIAGCLATAEDTLRTLDETSTAGPQAWVDEALQALPPDALVLTESPNLGQRLLTAQAEGYRPDVLLVPLSDVTNASTLAKWLEREPLLEILLRDLSLSDTPSERAITALADKRPVFLEATPSWDKRLLEHMLPGSPLLAFSTHALARSDRMAALDRFVAPHARILHAQKQGLNPDEATEHIMRKSVDALAKVLKRVGDKPALKRLREIDPIALDEPTAEHPVQAPVASLK